MAAGAIHLHDKYSKEIEQAFYKESVVKGLLSKKYGWIGVQTVKISTLVSQDLNTYDRTASSNRYGTPTEMTEIVQLMKLTQEPSFSITIDKGNNKDQHNIKGAARALAVQIREKCTPNYDKYVLAALATKAGKIYGVSTDVSASNIADRIMTGTASLDDAEAPDSGRLLYISAAKFKLLKLCDEYVALEKTGTKALVKGEVGEFDGMRVIKVPSGRWPSGVNFMIVHKEAACAPVKLDDTKVHVDPPGISGNLLEGRQYFDCFVFGAKCNGVYVDVDTDVKAIAGAPVITAAGGAITEGDATTIYYTTDGTDPRYSDTRLTIASGSAPSNHANGLVVKAYCERTNYYPSAVTTQTLTS